MSKPHPEYGVAVARDERVLDLRAGRDFWLHPACIARSLGLDRLPARLDDLARLAAAAHVADTACRRGAGGGWSRQIELTVAVSDPRFWAGDRVGTLVRESLSFIGGDHWGVRFVAEARRVPDAAQYPLAFYDPPVLCLYSGGLDSASGLATRLRGLAGERVLAVTVRHQSNVGMRAGRQVRAMRDHFGLDPAALDHVSLGTFVRQSRLRASGIDRPERSHRCRAFLFAALGGVVAGLTRAGRIEVYESGVGAVNLPLMQGMSGSLTTRGCHPRFFRLMGELVSLVLGRRVEYALPFLDRTKGEMAGVLAGEGLGGLAGDTVSCVRDRLRRKTGKQCGACPGCVFRRQALLTAGVADPATGYVHDLFGDRESADRVPEPHRAVLRAFLQQVARLAPLDRPGGVPPRLRGHLLGTGVVAPDDHAGLAGYADVFRRYRGEWRRLAAAARDRDLWWGGLLGHQPVAA